MKRLGAVQPLVIGICLIFLLLTSSALIYNYRSAPNFDMEALIEKSHRVLAYSVTNELSAIFRVSPHDERVEIASNLDLSATDISAIQDQSAMPQYDYRLKAELLDESGNILETNLMYEKTTHKIWNDAEKDCVFTSAFYLDSDLTPCDSRISSIHLLKNRSNETYLSIKLTEPLSHSASIRVYTHADQSPSNEVVSVKPLGNRLKAKIARHHLFGLKAKPIELKRFLSDVWEQIPAEGRSGIDYFPKEIFLHDKIAPITGSAPSESNFVISPEQPLRITIRKGETFEIKFLDSVPLRVKMYDTFGTTSESVFIPNPGEMVEYPIESSPRMLEIRTETQDACNIVLPLANSRQENKNLINETVYYRTMPMNQGVPVIIKMPYSGSAASSPIKVSCRMPVNLNDASEFQEAVVMYRFKSSKSNRVAEGKRQIKCYSKSLAVYDENMLDSAKSPSVADSFMMIPSLDSDTIEFISDKPVDLAFFTCPKISNEASTPFEMQADSSTYPDRFSFVDAASEKKWFYFRPVNAVDLESASRKSGVQMPVDVIETVSDERASESIPSFQTLKPEETASTSTLFEPVESGYLIPSGKSCYASLTASKKYSIRILSQNESIHYLQFRYNLAPITKKVGTIRVLVDGESSMVFRPVSVEGAFQISLRGFGNHLLKIESERTDDRFLLKIQPEMEIDASYIAPRTVFSLSPNKTLKIPYIKESENRGGVNIMLYSESESADVQIEAELEGALDRIIGRPFKRWTPAKRNFTGRLTSEAGKLITTNGIQFNSKSRIYFPLNDDLGPGKYNLTIRSLCDSVIYARFFARSN